MNDATKRGRRTFLGAMLALPALLFSRRSTAAVGEFRPVSMGVFPVAGWQYYKGDAVLDRLRVGGRVEARREPHNRYDANAIALYAFGEKLGYVPRKYNFSLAAMMDDGGRPRFVIRQTTAGGDRGLRPWPASVAGGAGRSPDRLVGRAGRVLPVYTRRVTQRSGADDAGGPFHVHRLPDGLTLLAEPMPGMRSCAVNLLVPAGVAGDPADRVGCAGVTQEMTLRGAGVRDARALTEALDDLGLSRSSGVGSTHARYAAAGLAKNVLAALPIYADIVRRPTLADDQFGPSRELAQQALAGLDDNPQAIATTRLREVYWPSPLGRNPTGDKAGLAAMTPDDARALHRRRFHARGTVIAVAGDVDPRVWADAAADVFGGWGEDVADFAPPGDAAGGNHFVGHKSEQTHVALAYAAPGETADDYYLARLAVEVLSGGMSGRLFTEIREKQGLCYSVHAGYNGQVAYHDLPAAGAVFAYAGTSNDRAQATLDSLVNELRRLSRGVTDDELRRAKVGLRAGTVMGEESTSARSGALARDWLVRGRLRTPDETLAAINAVTTDALNAWLTSHPPGGFTTVIVGPRPLAVPD